jgi:hypothetical protein
VPIKSERSEKTPWAMELLASEPEAASSERAAGRGPAAETKVTKLKMMAINFASVLSLRPIVAVGLRGWFEMVRGFKEGWTCWDVKVCVCGGYC